jgi:hypothetical protein
MTPHTQAELEELHMSPEQLEERTRKMDALAKSGTQQGVSNPEPEITNGTVGQAPSQPTRTRKARADKGAWYLSVPGVRFDMSQSEGRGALRDWVDAQQAIGLPAMRNAAHVVMSELLTHCDRLRK